jgi:hypothetical protein
MLLGVFCDFLWFVLNPDYGEKNKFRTESIPWQSGNWLAGKFPASYLYLGLLSFLLALTSSVLNHVYLTNYFVLLLLFTFLKAVTVKIAPFYHRLRTRPTKESKDE